MERHGCFDNTIHLFYKLLLIFWLAFSNKVLSTTILQSSRRTIQPSPFIDPSSTHQQFSTAHQSRILLSRIVVLRTSNVLLGSTVQDIISHTVRTTAGTNVTVSPTPTKTIEPSKSTTTKAVATTTTTITATARTQIYKFYVEGKFQFNANDDEPKALNHVTHKLSELLTPHGQLNSTNISISLRNGTFQSILYFDAARQTVFSQIVNILNSDGLFSSVHVKEQCTKDSCGDAQRGKCHQGTNRIYCSCNIGFLGERCSIAYAVDGHTYGPWSNWTECENSCEQKRFRYCTPDPINGGKCSVGPNPWIEVKTCYECAKKDKNTDYRTVAFVSLAILIVIFVLLIAFCCTYKLIAYEKRKKSGDSLDTTDFIRVPPAIVRTPQDKKKRSINGVKQKNPVSIQMRDFQTHKGLDNPAYTGEEFGYNGNDLYRRQLALFLKQAPGLSQNGVSTGSPEVQHTSTNDKKHHKSVINKNNSSSRSSESEVNSVNQSDSKDSKSEKNVSFTPAVKKRKEISAKIVDRGPSKHKLVIE